ncbi:MAG TPA: TetR/AcrR family transcriptional regulator [Ktedonobacterales bacterium]
MAGETHQRILEATEKLIQMNGLARVTTRDIARETGLSEGALYRHFDHKEEILFAVVSKYLPALLDVFQAHPAGTSTIRANVTALTLAVLRYYGHLFPITASCLADTSLLTRYREAIHQHNGGPQTIFTLVAAYIEEEQQLGRIGQRIPALSIATLLLGPCLQRVFMTHMLGQNPFDQTDEQFADELVQALMVSTMPA